MVLCVKTLSVSCIYSLNSKMTDKFIVKKASALIITFSLCFNNELKVVICGSKYKNLSKIIKI